MAKEFDIYLGKRLVECDLLVYSIPYRDGITATNRLILEAALNGYLLQKIAAVQIGSELITHIDNMIKLCFEKLRIGAAIDASAQFNAYGKLCVENSPVIIDVSPIDTIVRVMNECEARMELAVKPFDIHVSKSIGTGSFPLAVDTQVSGIFKHSILDLRSAFSADAAVVQFNQVDYVDANAPVIVDSTLNGLYYQLSFDASAAVEIVSLLLGADVLHSLGVWYSGVAIGSKVTGTFAKKFDAAQAITSIMQEATEKLIKILYPEDSDTIVEILDLSISMKRYRLLSELDDLRLADIDGMTLEELDYVWLV